MEQDLIAAHLDRGWDLLGRDDFLGARVSASQVLEIDGDSPDGHTLLGAIAAAQSEHEEALEAFRRALDVDPEHVAALLCAADLALYSLQDCRQALDYLSTAEEVLDDDGDQFAELQLLRADACLGLGEHASAREALSRLGERVLSDCAYLLRQGRAWLDLEDIDRALPLLRGAARDEACAADAAYLLGVASHLQDDHAAGVRYWIEAHAHEGRNRAGQNQATGEFERMVNKVYATMPSRLAAELEGVCVVVDELPPIELVAEGVDPRACVFVAGVAVDGSLEPSIPTAVCVYKKNVERLSSSPGQLADALYREMLAEMAAFFQLDEDSLPELAAIDDCQVRA